MWVCMLLPGMWVCTLLPGYVSMHTVTRVCEYACCYQYVSIAHCYQGMWVYTCCQVCKYAHCCQGMWACKGDFCLGISEFNFSSTPAIDLQIERSNLTFRHVKYTVNCLCDVMGCYERKFKVYVKISKLLFQCDVMFSYASTWGLEYSIPVHIPNGNC